VLIDTKHEAIDWSSYLLSRALYNNIIVSQQGGFSWYSAVPVPKNFDARVISMDELTGILHEWWNSPGI
jgi:hypothetical protein